MGEEKSFTVKISCRCGAEFYYSFASVASGDQYYPDARTHATNLYSEFKEEHKECNGFLSKEDMKI